MATNSSQYADSEDTTSNMSAGIAVQISFCAALMFAVITGNSFVVAAYFSNWRIRTSTYTFLVSLAFSDLLVGAVSLPLYVYISVERIYSGTLNTFFVSFDIFSALASIFHLTAVSLERWVAVSRPFLYETLSTVQYSLVICGVWLTAFAIAAVRPALDTANSKKIYTPFLLLVGYIGPGVLISLVNYSIFRITHALTTNLPTVQDIEETRELRKNISKQRRTAMTLGFVTCLFLVSWLSFFTINTVLVLCYRCLPLGKLNIFLVFSKWLQYSNSAMNPLVYTFRDAEMRRTFIRLLGPCRRVFETQGERRRVAPAITTSAITTVGHTAECNL